MKTLREIAKDNAREFINGNIETLNVLSHRSHNHIWVEVLPDGTVHLAEEASMQTYHANGVNVLDIARCEYCGCDACASYDQAFDGDIDNEGFARSWGFDRQDVEEDFFQHLRDFDFVYYDFENDVIAEIDNVEYGFFDDEK